MRWAAAVGATLLGVAVALGVVWWRAGALPLSAPLVGPDAIAPLDPATLPAGAARPVVGNPGWESLGADDRKRAERPLGDSAREWLDDHGPDVRRVAAAFDVSPVALGGLVAVEKTLLVGRVDDVGDDLFRAVFGSLREADLERWVADQETRYRRGRADGNGSIVRNPYLWTLGPAQVSFRLAVQYEPAVARRLNRRERSARQVLQAVTSPSGNLEYAAALLAEAQRAYLTIAGMDIAGNPGVLATLYHLGAPTVRARRLAADNAAREARGEPAHLPQVNFYGAFVNLNASEIAERIGAAPPE
ncbi:MAG TPA: DUF1402 family protein [Gemmatimonadota bacterium]|nr:DUF1402 family protein [Gemmatimonadota bacterium]